MKKIFSTTLAMAITASSLSAVTVSAAGQSFPDVPESHWAYNIVEAITARHAFDGYEDGTFRPNNTMTHEEFVKTVVSLISDVDTTGASTWYQPYIDKATELGFISSSDGNYLKQGTPITRQEMAKFVVKVLEWQGKTLTADMSSCENTITDWSSISDEYKIYVAKAIAAGIINGYEDNSFKPENNLSRIEASAVIARLLGDIATDNNSSSNSTENTVSASKKNIEEMTQNEKNALASKLYNSGRFLNTTIDGGGILLGGINESTIENFLKNYNENNSEDENLRNQPGYTVELERFNRVVNNAYRYTNMYLNGMYKKYGDAIYDVLD